MLKTRFKGPGRKGFPRRMLSHASTNDTNAKNPKIKRAQAPTDIGDQYLKLKLVCPGVTLTSMCQNLVQLSPRSAVRRIGQMTVAGKLTRNATRAAASSRASPDSLRSVPIA